MATMTDEGIPLDYQHITKGPGRYAFLIEGLHNRPETLGAQMFEISHVDVPIKITAARQIPHWQCPRMHEHLRGNAGPEWDWADAWEFEGYVPGHGIPVRGVYSTHSRKGVCYLWQASINDYGCPGARRDIALHFSSQIPDESEMALIRAMIHMNKGTPFNRQSCIKCQPCWSFYHALRRSCDVAAE